MAASWNFKASGFSVGNYANKFLNKSRSTTSQHSVGSFVFVFGKHKLSFYISMAL